MLQEGTRGSDNADILENCRPIVELFKEANPNVKFFFLVHHNVHRSQYAWIPTIKNLENENVTVVDWGSLVCDIMYYNTRVPNGKMEYSPSSFIISKSESDGFHPNPL